MSEYYNKCQFYAGSCHYPSPNHYDPNYVYRDQYRPDQYYPDCYPYYQSEPTLVPSHNGTPPSEEDNHHSDIQSESGDEVIGEEPEQQAVSKSKPQRSKPLSRLPQVTINQKWVWPCK